MAYRYSKVITKGGMTRSSAKSHIAREQALLFGQAKRASRVLARPVLLAQIGELSRRLRVTLFPE